MATGASEEACTAYNRRKIDVIFEGDGDMGREASSITIPGAESIPFADLDVYHIHFLSSLIFILCSFLSFTKTMCRQFDDLRSSAVERLERAALRLGFARLSKFVQMEIEDRIWVSEEAGLRRWSDDEQQSEKPTVLRVCRVDRLSIIHERNLPHQRPLHRKS